METSTIGLPFDWLHFDMSGSEGIMKKYKAVSQYGAIFAIFGYGSFIFLFQSLYKKDKKLTPLLCACAVVNNLETHKCWKETHAAAVTSPNLAHVFTIPMAKKKRVTNDLLLQNLLIIF